MARSTPSKAFDPVIVTAKLPAICPSCAQPVKVEPREHGFRVSCTRGDARICSWAASYTVLTGEN